MEKAVSRPQFVIGPEGYPLTLVGLPPVRTTRWTARRKAEVVAAVNGGLLEFLEACERYQLTLEELATWQRTLDRAGLLGLRATKLKQYQHLYDTDQRLS